eukprot:1140702-Pelagomonas_calceolata.AAC.1
MRTIDQAAAAAAAVHGVRAWRRASAIDGAGACGSVAAGPGGSCSCCKRWGMDCVGRVPLILI